MIHAHLDTCMIVLYRHHRNRVSILDPPVFDGLSGVAPPWRPLSGTTILFKQIELYHRFFLLGVTTFHSGMSILHMPLNHMHAIHRAN